MDTDIVCDTAADDDSLAAAADEDTSSNSPSPPSQPVTSDAAGDSCALNDPVAPVSLHSSSA